MKYRSTDSPIENPLPGFRNDFVGRMIRGDTLYIRPFAPKPEELHTFGIAANDAGFTPGRETFWGSERAPGYWYRA